MVKPIMYHINTKFLVKLLIKTPVIYNHFVFRLYSYIVAYIDCF